MPGNSFENGDVGVEQEVRFQFAADAVGMNLHIIIFNMYTCRSQYRIVVRAEGVEVFGIDFGCPVSTHQVVLEEDTYFGHDGAAVAVAGCGYLDAGQ